MLAILALWCVIFGASLASPPLLDDADATHAQAAQAMLQTGDWVTLHVDGIRYLEKPPLPYWIAALSLRLFGSNGNRAAFAIHLPIALTALGLALLGYAWSRRAFGQRAALYTAVFTLTTAGVFLFTRIFIPDALLSLLLAITLFAFLRALDPGCAHPKRYAYLLWFALACAVLTKGLVALVFFFGTAIVFSIATRETRHWHRLQPFTGLLLFLAVAAPWHIFAGRRNIGGANGHGFFWFYFINEHVLRFLGERIPRDYNKVPGALYWPLHLVWLFPWSFFAPVALLIGWRKRRELQSLGDLDSQGQRLSRLEILSRHKVPVPASFAYRTVLLLLIFSTLVIVFFAFSTNQEYYTFPAYLPLLMLLAAALATIERGAPTAFTRRAFTLGYATLTLLGLIIASALAYGLWTARHLPFLPDIGSVLAHRGVGGYTLSMSHFFDLTGPSFAALRLPAFLAALAFAFGPATAWVLHTKQKSFAALMTIASTSAAFLIAAHLALMRFAPTLSSQNFALTIQYLGQDGRIAPGTTVLLYGDQAYGSSIPFYLGRRVDLVDGRSSSMLFGSTFADAPPIFVTHQQLAATWGNGSRKILFVPLEKRDEVDHLLGPRAILLAESSGKALLTDRSLETGSSSLQTERQPNTVDTIATSPGR